MRSGDVGVTGGVLVLPDCGDGSTPGLPDFDSFVKAQSDVNREAKPRPQPTQRVEQRGAPTNEPARENGAARVSQGERQEEAQKRLDARAETPDEAPAVVPWSVAAESKSTSKSTEHDLLSIEEQEEAASTLMAGVVGVRCAAQEREQEPQKKLFPLGPPHEQLNQVGDGYNFFDSPSAQESAATAGQADAVFSVEKSPGEKQDQALDPWAQRTPLQCFDSTSGDGPLIPDVVAAGKGVGLNEADGKRTALNENVVYLPDAVAGDGGTDAKKQAQNLSNFARAAAGNDAVEEVGRPAESTTGNQLDGIRHQMSLACQECDDLAGQAGGAGDGNEQKNFDSPGSLPRRASKMTEEHGQGLNAASPFLSTVQTNPVDVRADVAGVARQIAGAVELALHDAERTGTGVYHLRLHPEELGEVVVEVRFRDDGTVAITMDAANEQVRGLLLEQVATLKEQCVQRGLRLENVSVGSSGTGDANDSTRSEQRDNQERQRDKLQEQNEEIGAGRQVGWAEIAAQRGRLQWV